QEIVMLATQLGDPVRERLFLERSAQVFGVSERVLHRAMGLKKQGQRSEAPITTAVRTQRGALGYVERQVLKLLVVSPEHLDEVHGHLSPRAFEGPACRELAESLWDGRAPEGVASTLERELLAEPTEPGAEAELPPLVRRLIQRRLRRRQRDVD